MRVRSRKIGKPFFPKACREFAAAAQDRHRKLQIRRKHEQAQRSQRPIERLTREKYPAAHQYAQHCNLGETTPQVVQNLPAGNQIDGVANDVAVKIRHPREQPEKNLPVAAYPAVFAFAVRRYPRRIIINHFDVRDQSSPCIRSFNHVVAENRVRWEAPLDNLLENFHFIDAFAGKAAFRKQVLIHIGHCSCIHVKTGVA